MRFNNAAATNNIGSITVNAGKVILANMVNNGGNGGLIANAAGTIDLNPGSDQTFANLLHGAGIFNKEGTNILTLTGDHDNSGVFNINGGTLELRTPIVHHLQRPADQHQRGHHLVHHHGRRQQPL